MSHRELRAPASFIQVADDVKMPGSTVPRVSYFLDGAGGRCRKNIFVAEQLLPLLDEKRLEMVARNRSIKAKDGESIAKLLTAFARKADEGIIGKLIVQVVTLLSARSQSDGGKVLRAAAQA
jgi:hypothetical protein